MEYSDEKSAIHGFGRIGRTLQHIGLQRNLFTAAAISDIKDAPSLAALSVVDTNYRLWQEPVEGSLIGFNIGGRAIPYYNAQKELPPTAALPRLVLVCFGRLVALGTQRRCWQGGGGLLAFDRVACAQPRHAATFQAIRTVAEFFKK